MSGDVLFSPVSNRSPKVRCNVCGGRGYEGGKWQDWHRRGHLPCPLCGKLITVLRDGTARTHGRCPTQGGVS